MDDNNHLLVTRGGECFRVHSQGKDRADNRDGVLHYFHLTDMAKNRGTRRVSVYRGGPRDFYAPNIAEFDRRIDMVLLNRIRRSFDSGELTFDVPESETYMEVSVKPSDFQPQHPATDPEIRQLILHTAYWLGYRHGQPHTPRHLVQFDSDGDLEYLGVEARDVRRNQWLLEEDGLLEKSNLAGSGVPTSALVKAYESNDGTNTPTAESEDRRFARLAIEEARKSVPENDGRPHPLVGAVVVKNGQVLATAHRGEAEGNHAEYIALEKRLADAAVAGATVYTTLEPCTTRNHPKIPCGDRLIERRVRRVVIGMLDPDPRITGRGQRKLRSANIITDFFPHDLMTEVEELNREFTRNFESARAASALAVEPMASVVDDGLSPRERRRQAEQVSGWVDRYTGPEVPGKMFEGIVLRNGSDALVYYVIVSLVSYQGAFRNTAVGDKREFEFRAFIGRLPPGITKTHIESGGGGMHLRLAVELAFQDTAGRYWLRTGDGKLEEVQQHPLELYGIGPPVPWQYGDQ
jgi:pyrimidine deaminase RibD-like protein